MAVTSAKAFETDMIPVRLVALAVLGSQMPVAGDLITNVVASFVFEGIKRCYGVAKTTIRRRQTISRALDGHYDIRNEAAASGIADLEMVIGADRGQLTEPVAALLRDLETSAIPDTIVRTILSGEDTDQLFPAFNLIFQSFTSTLSFDSRSFYSALVAAIRERAEARVRDPGLLEFVQAHNKALSNQLRDIIRALRLAGESKEDIRHEVLADARLKIARAVENANRFVNVETLQGVKRCNIRQLVVPPEIKRVGKTCGSDDWCGLRACVSQLPNLIRPGRHLGRSRRRKIHPHSAIVP